MATNLKLRWQALGENIDLIAMFTGFYDPVMPHLDDAVEPSSAATT